MAFVLYELNFTNEFELDVILKSDGPDKDDPLFHKRIEKEVSKITKLSEISYAKYLSTIIYYNESHYKTLVSFEKYFN